MGSLNIQTMRESCPGKSDEEAAKAFAQKHGYIAIVRYKSGDASDFTNIGTCTTESEIRAYLTSPYCSGAEIIYDGRSTLFPLNADHVMKGHCEMCGRHSTRETLQMGSGNDFYFCPKCGLLFCDSCYVRLPLTGSPGYGMCPKCKVEVKRAIPSFFIAESVSATTRPPSPKAQPQTQSRAQEAPMNQDTLTVIEADGLYRNLPTGLVVSEELHLSTCFVTYAIECGAEGRELFDAIRAEAPKKYPATGEQTKVVLQAINILLAHYRMNDYKRGIVEKAKAALEGTTLPSPVISHAPEIGIASKAPGQSSKTISKPPQKKWWQFWM